MSDRKNIYIGILVCSAICIGAGILAILRRSQRSYIEKAIVYPQIHNGNTILSDQIQYQKIKQLIEQNKILKAIENMPNQTDRDKENQTILRTYLAEQEAQQNTLTGRQLARKYAEQANIIAQQNQIGKKEIQAQNESIILATCIQENSAIVQNRSAIIDKQTQIIQTIAQIDEMLHTKNLPINCEDTLLKNIENNQQTLTLWIQESKKQLQLQKQINRDMITHITCDIQNTPQRYKLTDKAIQENNKYLITQQGILYALEQNESDLIDQLCKGKNDSQLDNQLSTTMQELIHQGDKNKAAASTNIIKYQDIDQDIQDIIQEKQTTNTSLIQTIQQTIYTNTYDPLQYIQKLFQQFFGHTNDFISP